MGVVAAMVRCENWGNCVAYRLSIGVFHGKFQPLILLTSREDSVPVLRLQPERGGVGWVSRLEDGGEYKTGMGEGVGMQIPNKV